ncbi:MAG: GDP-L-fucose synthase [Candidatus Micrarchaeota archaeon]|nr:GDP-L-fucose synthase [Candidatus Micrarchaeota archaeon]
MRVLVTGANGFIGTALLPRLKKAGHETIAPSRLDYDLLEQARVRALFRDVQADTVIHLAARVGGIMANKAYPGEFIYQNMGMNTIFLEEARRAGVKRLIYSFCGCSFGKNAPNPIKEEYLFREGGLPDENAMFYSLGKAANHLQLVAYRRQHGLDWVSLIPGNAYGPHDNFSEKNSHVIPGLMRRFHFAKERGDKQVEVWGSGKPVRDFVYVDDVADAFVLALDKHHEELPINVSSGVGVSIRETAEAVAEAVGFEGKIAWDSSKPDGHMAKVFDTKRMRRILGFNPRVGLKEGIRKTYDWFAANQGKARL